MGLSHRSLYPGLRVLIEHSGPIILLLVTAASLVLIHTAQKAIPRGVLVPCLLMLLLMAHAYATRSRQGLRNIVTGVALGVGFVTAYWLRHSLRFTQPNEWDFLPFYLSGQVAARGLDFYRPESHDAVLMILNIPFSPSPGFFAEHMVTAFPYPPPSMFLFLPLGHGSFETANILWLSSIVLIFAVDVYLLYRLFLRDDGVQGLVLAALLMLALPATQSIFAYEQTTFLALLAGLLFWRDRARPRAGVWVVLGALVKPPLAILLLYPLLQRQWRSLVAAAGTVLVACLAAVLVFGVSIFTSYFLDGPMARIPPKMYVQPENHSLLAHTIRIFGHDFSLAPPVSNPIFLTAAGALTLISLWALCNLRPAWRPWSIGCLLPYAIIVYPQSLSHYTALLVIPLILIYAEFRRTRTGLVLSSAFAALSYWLMGHHPLTANALVWATVILVGIRCSHRDPAALPKPSPPPDSPAVSVDEIRSGAHGGGR